MFRRFLTGFVYAGRGLCELLRERNARVHALITVCVFVAGFVVRFEPWEWVSVILASGIVWAAEALNTAIERLVDLASPEQHPLARKAKDLAAGAVLLAAIAAVAVAVVIILGRLRA